MEMAEGLIRDIDERVLHIHSQGSPGAKVEEVATEQAKALLQTFSQVGSIDLGVVTKVGQHLLKVGVWSNCQLSAFSACLRANATARLHQPGTRPMQSSPCLEHYLLQKGLG